jgi:hypothetical protein
MGRGKLENYLRIAQRLGKKKKYNYRWDKMEKPLSYIHRCSRSKKVASPMGVHLGEPRRLPISVMPDARWQLSTGRDIFAGNLQRITASNLAAFPHGNRPFLAIPTMEPPRTTLA